jgi:phage tail sheath protein FI
MPFSASFSGTSKPRTPLIAASSPAGAFQGSTPDQAYYVKCDAETTTQADRNLGIVNIEVGFAPLKPAEFVVVKLQQLAGQLDV